MFGPETVAIMTVFCSFVSVVLARINIAPSIVIIAGNLLKGANNRLIRWQRVEIGFFGVYVIDSGEIHRLQITGTIATEMMLPSISSKALSIS